MPVNRRTTVWDFTTWDTLLSRGYNLKTDGTGDERGYSLVKESANYRLVIDPWGDVELEQKDKEGLGVGDGLRLCMSCPSSLELAESWIENDQPRAQPEGLRKKMINHLLGGTNN